MRRYIQYNDLVFDGRVESKEFPTYSFKSTSIENKFWHGENVEFNGLLQKTTLNLNIIYDLTDMNCVYRRYFRSFIISQISKAGKVWAIDDDRRLLYANAFVETYTLNDEYPNRFEIDMSLSLYDGVWNIASGTTTFMVDWSLCNFLDCIGYREIDEQCNCYTGANHDCEEGCCICNDVTVEDSLYNINLSKVNGDKFVIDDEVLGRKLNGKKALGYKLEMMKSGVYLKSENLYIPTDIPCYCDIYLYGIFDTPYIKINDNENYLDLKTSGHSARLVGMKCNGDLIEIADCVEGVLPIKSWQVPNGQEFGFELKPLYNNISINRGTTNGAFEVYVRPHCLTI